MDLDRKLAILADAAKYDASCASSGTEMRDSSDRLYQADWLMRFYGFEAGETGGAVQAEGRAIGIWVLSKSSLRAKRSNPNPLPQSGLLRFARNDERRVT